MASDNSLLTSIYRQMYFNRQFELLVAKLIKDKRISIPVYLSIGQESISATICSYFSSIKKEFALFPQHRCHSWLLSRGVSPLLMLKELLGQSDGLNGGKGGSASMSSKEQKIFGHSGLLADQGPIACGYAESGEFTVCVTGCGGCEEDMYVCSLGYAATRKLPVLFIIEDNGLSILTETKTRRSWHICDIARGFGMRSYDTYDNPLVMLDLLQKISTFNGPTLINIKTERHYWHAGAGQDNPPKIDRLLPEGSFLSINSSEDAAKIRNEVDLEIEQLCNSVN